AEPPAMTTTNEMITPCGLNCLVLVWYVPTAVAELQNATTRSSAVLDTPLVPAPNQPPPLVFGADPEMTCWSAREGSRGLPGTCQAAPPVTTRRPLPQETVVLTLPVAPGG